MMAAAYAYHFFEFIKCLESNILGLGSPSHLNAYFHFPLLLDLKIFLFIEFVRCKFSEVSVQASYLQF